ncbi:hypothetical protein [Ktedonospora formicarum]|uniref:Uncharacterized protein n=1 Tax=Ktedonospora formicarum TaxID=2778364 RepID=A0A8J3I012_9CHLR|nr:hypothetical protein [Ktedonospora formicarum]GHO45121.1 hypothetical protein KSX_32840 [Ktedonospora formicarum]
MQQFDRNRQPTTDKTQGNTRPQAVIITALLLFAITGLLSGFTFNAMNRPKKATNTPPPVVKTSPTVKATKAPSNTPTVRTTPDVGATNLGCPDAKYSDYTQAADGTTTYTADIQATGKGKKGPSNCSGDALKASGITCKLWLTKDPDATGTALSKDNNALLHNLNALGQPIPGEEPNALIFSSDTPSLQPCGNDGKATWKYQVGTTVQPGTYYLYYLTDWKGQRFNWSVKAIQIKKAA